MKQTALETSHDNYDKSKETNTTPDRHVTQQTITVKSIKKLASINQLRGRTAPLPAC